MRPISDPARILKCPECHAQVESLPSTGEKNFFCARCSHELQIHIFAAFSKPPVRGILPASVLHDEASCFYHEEKQAHSVCEECGRFICSLCDLEFQGRHHCPECMGKVTQKNKSPSLVTRQILHDQVALSIAMAPIFFWPATLISCWAALYYSFKHWNSPGGIAGSSKLRFTLAVGIALLQVAFWGLIIADIIHPFSGGKK